MKPIVLFYSHDHIFQGVKQEASLYAERKSDAEGNDLFEQLVFDEEYLIKFRELFFDGQAEVTPALSAYMREVPVDAEYFEMQDFSNNRDYKITLAMPDNWNFHLAKPLDIKIKQFLIAYIMYRWLETKFPEDASVFALRSEVLLEDIRALLGKRIGPVRRNHTMYEQ